MCIKIVSTGTFLPGRKVLSEELDKELDKPKGWIAERSGVHERYRANGETQAEMCKMATHEALSNSNLELSDIDCIISACGATQQAIPANAILVKRELGIEDPSVEAFDVNMTCLSFIKAIELGSYLLQVNKYKNILIVAAEKPSLGINKNSYETYSIFGDGAAAMLITKDPEAELPTSYFEIMPEGLEFTTLKYLMVNDIENIRDDINQKEDYYFKMHGKAVFKLAARKLPLYMKRFFSKTKYNMEDVDFLVPHQTSALGMAYAKNKLGFPSDTVLDYIKHYGNQMAVSIPHTLHHGIMDGTIKRGQLIMLFGTGAGFSIGGILLRY